jgi:hypothetical protein
VTWFGRETDIPLSGEGTPTVAEFAVAEFAAALGMSPTAGESCLGEALELRYRLPAVWRRVRAGDLPAWRARRIARETMRLTRDAARYVDTHLAPVAHKISPAALDRAVNEAIGRYMSEEVQRLAEASWDKRHVTLHDQLVSFTGTMHLEAELDIADALDLDAAVSAGAEARAALGSTEPLDVRRAQAIGDLARRQLALDLSSACPADPEPGASSALPVKPRQVILHVHLSDQALRDRGIDPRPEVLARLERGNALITAAQVRAWCGHPDTQVVVKPVIDLDTCVASDTDQVPVRIAEHVALRDQTCIYPWCTRPARRATTHEPEDSDRYRHPCDNDHAIPRGRGGPTCTCNLAPLCRRHHRLKTHSSWSYVILDPGTYLWTSPHGYQYLRDPHGTRDVSRDVSPGWLRDGPPGGAPQPP